MRILPPPDAATAPESLKARLRGLLYAHRWRLVWLAGSAAFGLFCRGLPDGAWREFCMLLASGADRAAEFIP